MVLDGDNLGKAKSKDWEGKEIPRSTNYEYYRY